MSEAKHTMGPLSVRMDGTCSGAWATIGQECIDPDSGETWFRELAHTETTHKERGARNGQPLSGMPGDINEKPERFEPTADSAELIANALLWAAAPEMLEAMQAAIDCGMVPVSSAADGGAVRHSRQVQVADMIRAAIAKATGGAA